MTRPDTREMLTSSQVCELLGINRNNLKQITYRGTHGGLGLVPVKKKAGRLVQYPADEVRAYKAIRDAREKK